MTNQEAFDKIWERAKDKRRSTSPVNSACLYRGPDGLKCFVGVLIPDAEYSPDFEVGGVDRIAQHVPTLAGLDIAMLKECQLVHDAYLPSEWRFRLRLVAESFGLQVPEDS
jgi:hypothetical protein